MANWLGQEVPKLGFGMMRLPTLQDNEVDLAQVTRMADAFFEGGFTYIDTAYGYHHEQSEVVVRKTVVERYPRDRFILATKLPLWHIKEAGDPQRLFDTQLERTQAGYFDYYMLHAFNKSYIAKLDELDVWAFLRGLKEKGLVRHIGMSFHDSAAVLEEVLAAHPEMEFVQLQLNYADWEDPDVEARACYETARRHGCSVIVMEPVKGGALAALPPKARAVLEAARPGASIASWAMRFAASPEGIITVLSGMSDEAQMADNIGTVRDFAPLTEADRAAIAQVQEILAATPTVPCTDCKYCVEDCPKDIPIPRILGVENRRRTYDVVDKGSYRMNTSGHGKASDCIQCGVCEGRCPQHIGIIGLMADCAATFE